MKIDVGSSLYHSRSNALRQIDICVDFLDEESVAAANSHGEVVRGREARKIGLTKPGKENGDAIHGHS